MRKNLILMTLFIVILMGCPRSKQEAFSAPLNKKKKSKQNHRLVVQPGLRAPSLRPLLMPQLKKSSSTLILKRKPVLAKNQAIALNTKGFRLYKRRKYAEAARYFRKAVQLDARYALAHWNLACTLGVLRKLRQICPNRAYLSEIVKHLKRAVELDKRYKSKMLTDKDLDPVRPTLGYQELLGYSAARVRDLGHLLMAVNWYGPTEGAFGHTKRLDFKKNSRVVLHYLDKNTFKWHRISGRYRLRGRRVIVILQRPLGEHRRFIGRLSKKGSLRVRRLATFTDQPSDCDA